MANKYQQWKTNTECEVSNTTNPYDEAGSTHNELMAKIESEGNPEMTLDEVFELSDNVLKDTYGDELVPGYSSKEFATPIINFDSEETYRNYINSLKINEEQKNLAFRLYDIMFTYTGTNLCEVIEQIKEFENEVLQNYKPEDIENVLISSSVGRYALAYWDGRVSENGTLALKGFWKKFFTAVADAIGAVGGAIVGAPTVAGGIAGGVVGAIGASAGFAEVWDVFAK